MAQARTAGRTLPQAAYLVPATLAVALVIGLIAAFGMIAVPGIDIGTLGSETSATVVQSGQEWQAQREQQAGYTDPVTQSGQDWELQREQQSGSDSVFQSGQDWEAQREQQSGVTPR